jgi:hypothetical protein
MGILHLKMIWLIISTHKRAYWAVFTAEMRRRAQIMSGFHYPLIIARPARDHTFYNPRKQK